MKIHGGPLVLLTATFLTASAEDVVIKAENAVVITFPSQQSRTYKLLGAESPTSGWNQLKDGILGTGGEVTIFYKSESDQKVFFKVETSDGPPGQRSLLSLAQLHLYDRDLSGYDLEGADLLEFAFTRCKFDNANLVGANLQKAGLDASSFVGADLNRANCSKAQLSGDFSGANLTDAIFTGSFLSGDFRTANLTGASFEGANFDTANFSGRILTNVNFRNAAFKRVNFDGTVFLSVNFEGCTLTEMNMIGSDLRGSIFRRTFLGGDWSGVNGSGNDFSHVKIAPGASFVGASFEGGNFEGLTVGENFLYGTPWPTFKNANFRNANLKNASLVRCDLGGADLTGANFTNADLRGVSLFGAVGFDANQAGTLYGAGPATFPGFPSGPAGTIMPDGSLRVGINP